MSSISDLLVILALEVGILPCSSLFTEHKHMVEIVSRIEA